MTDSELARAQVLHWKITGLVAAGDASEARAQRRELAVLRTVRAHRLLDEKDPDGWIDLYAAITQWGRIGEIARVYFLVHEGRQRAALFDPGHAEILRELAELESWLRGVRREQHLMEYEGLGRIKLQGLLTDWPQAVAENVSIVSSFPVPLQELAVRSRAVVAYRNETDRRVWTEGGEGVEMVQVYWGTSETWYIVDERAETAPRCATGLIKAANRLRVVPTQALWTVRQEAGA